MKEWTPLREINRTKFFVYLIKSKRLWEKLKNTVMVRLR